MLCKLFLISKCSAWSANRALDQFLPLPFCGLGNLRISLADLGNHLIPGDDSSVEVCRRRRFWLHTKDNLWLSMMLSGESPAMLFDLVMTRFEHNYNPHIIYDASCIAKEFGYNRELRRFMQLSITSDCFHEVNHKSCSNSFKHQNTINWRKSTARRVNRLTLP